MSQQTQDRSAQDLLVKLGDTNLVLSDSSKDIRDRKVIDSDGNDIGHVSALFIDKEQRKIRFLQVGAGGFLGLGEREFLVPVEDINRITEDSVHIIHSREHVVQSPHYDPSLTTRRDNDYWNPYYGYYGYPPYWGDMND
jgi:sporulation protein YlmC with PRC-barrel domain